MSIYSGKFNLDRLIFYHEKECHMGELSGNNQRAIFHNNALKLLRQVKENLENAKRD